MGRMKNVATVGAAAIVAAGLTAGMAPTAQASILKPALRTVTVNNADGVVSRVTLQERAGSVGPGMVAIVGENVVGTKANKSTKKLRSNASRVLVCQAIKGSIGVEKTQNLAVVCSKAGMVKTYLPGTGMTIVKSGSGNAAYAFSKTSMMLFPNGVSGKVPGDPLPSSYKVYKDRTGKNVISVMFNNGTRTKKANFYMEVFATKAHKFVKIAGNKTVIMNTEMVDTIGNDA